MPTPESARKPLPIDVEDVRRELRASDARVVLAAASALGALAVRVQLPETYASVVDDLVDEIANEIVDSQEAGFSLNPTCRGPSGNGT